MFGWADALVKDRGLRLHGYAVNWSRDLGLNQGPADYDPAALPTELSLVNRWQSFAFGSPASPVWGEG